MPSKTSRRSERRRDIRVDARLSMRLEGPPEDGQLAHVVTESQNISASGVYCTSSHFMAPLSKIALTIVLPRVPGSGGRQDLIKCEGIVVRCSPTHKRGDRKFELACMFSELDARRRDLIQQFVTWRNLQALRAATAPRSKPRAAAPVRNGTVSRAARPAAKKPATRAASAPRTKRTVAKKSAVRRAVTRKRTVN